MASAIPAATSANLYATEPVGRVTNGGRLSEESVDDLSRSGKARVWVVDPIDGMRELISGTPEWCISVGFVENGNAVAGGIRNPVSREVYLGTLGDGVTLNGTSVSANRRQSLEGAVVLASRSEVGRGEWDRFRNLRPVVSRPEGSDLQSGRPL